jgi:[NiFe] hydrogenase assembly HybE family chaperone
LTAVLSMVRVPAFRPQVGAAAAPWSADPSAALLRHFAEVARERMAGLDFLNPAVEVCVAECRCIAGDWLAALVTPWSIQLVLLPGGGTLWEDSAPGLRRRVALPAGELVFIGDAGEAGLPAYQYCPLIAPVVGIADTVAACAIARDALAAVLTAPLSPASVTTDESPPTAVTSRSRRTFLRMRTA